VVVNHTTHMWFTMNSQIMSILERFRLNHLVRIDTIKIDRDVITAMVERWRRETHTCYLLVNEMIVILEDVSYL
jgi:Plant mobile domain